MTAATQDYGVVAGAAAPTAKPSSSDKAPEWRPDFEQVHKTLKAAGQQILEGGAEFAEHGRKFVSEHFGPNNLPINTVVELSPTALTTFWPKSDCSFLHKTNELVFGLDLPGLAQKDVEVKIENQVLNISGCKKVSNSFANEKVDKLLHERSVGFFMRRFQLPLNAQQTQHTITMRHGVLEVRIKCDPDYVSDKAVAKADVVDKSKAGQ